MEDSTVISLEYEKVEALYNCCPNWSKFGRLIAESAYLIIIERQEMLHFQTPEERYKTILKKSLIFFKWYRRISFRLILVLSQNLLADFVKE